MNTSALCYFFILMVLSYKGNKLWWRVQSGIRPNIASNLVQQFTMILTLSNLLNMAKLQLLCKSESNHINLIKYAVSSTGDNVYQVSGLMSAIQHMFNTLGSINVKSSPSSSLSYPTKINCNVNYHSLILPMCIECCGYLQDISV